MIRDICRKILPPEVRWWIKKVFLKKYSGERNYLYHDSAPKFGTTEHTHWNLYNLALSYIPTGASVLDVGCGSGFGSYLISQKAEKVVALDYSKAAINFAKKNNQAKNVDFILSNIDDFDYQEKFDVVVMIEFLEHNVQPKSVLKRITCLLKEEGMMIISLPVFPDGVPLKRGWHFHEFTDSRFRDVFKDYNYKVYGLKNLAFVEIDFSNGNFKEFFSESLEAASTYFVIVKKT